MDRDNWYAKATDKADDVTPLIERLRELTMREVSRDGYCREEPVPINRDGPEAADELVALRERFALFDAALVDDPGDICAGISEDAIWAGVEAWQQADREMNEYVSGVSTDWDEGMIVAAIFKAVARAILSTPKQDHDNG